MMPDRSTIFALSTGRPPSGIAVVRVSGPEASTALAVVAGRLPKPRNATRAILRQPDSSAIDDAMVLWFPCPNSATGEDVAEFHIHGGRAVIASLLGALSSIDGLRPAEPGEFTRRAFENGKLDLVAAEALDDLIHADTEQQRRQALRQMSGLLGDRARDWRQRIIDAAALLEAGIDFSDEGDVAGELLAPSREAMATLRSEIAGVLASSVRSERLRDGLVVAIVGAPNVGKSTLLNCLAGREVAIVSPHAGTTRDVLEVHLDLSGYPITLIDTAGLRETADPVEQEGVERAQARAAEADLVLWLSDGEFGTDGPVVQAQVWRIATKADLATAEVADHSVSVQTGAGVGELVAAITAFAAEQFPLETGLITRARQRAMLGEAERALSRSLAASEVELIAEELRVAVTALGRLLGRVDVEDVLGAIFSRFCIGK